MRSSKVLGGNWNQALFNETVQPMQAVSTTIYVSLARGGSGTLFNAQCHFILSSGEKSRAAMDFGIR